MTFQYVAGAKKPIKAWVNGVDVDENAFKQLRNLANMPFVYSHVAAMPDVHVGIGATIGSVFATEKAVIPSACGVVYWLRHGCHQTRWPNRQSLARQLEAYS